jgi:hypothetical protein
MAMPMISDSVRPIECLLEDSWAVMLTSLSESYNPAPMQLDWPRGEKQAGQFSHLYT